jgi:hypothetical protein
VIHEARAEQKLITGLLYVNPKTHTFHDELRMVDAPLSTLPLEQVRPPQRGRPGHGPDKGHPLRLGHRGLALPLGALLLQLQLEVAGQPFLCQFAAADRQTHRAAWLFLVATVMESASGGYRLDVWDRP